MPKSMFALVLIMFLFAGIIILGGCVTPGPFPETTPRDSETKPSGGDNDYCRQYADRALQQIAERIERTGSSPNNDPAWTKNWDQHYNWCANFARPGEPEAGTRNRQDWLDSHSAGSSGNSKKAICRQYADRALQQISERKERTGSSPADDPVWSKNWDQHYNWCVNFARPGEAEAGTRNRQDWLDSHSTGSSGSSKEAFCREYTENALAQIRVRKKMGSVAPAVIPAPNDPVWKEDFDHHYNWCLQVPESIANEGSAQRQDWLDQHRKK